MRVNSPYASQLLPFRRSADRRRPLANRVAKDVPAHGTAWANGYRSSGASEIPLAVRLATAPNGRGQAISEVPFAAGRERSRNEKSGHPPRCMAPTPWRGGQTVTPSARCRAGCRFGGARAGLSQLPDGRLAYRLKGPLPTLAVDPRSPLTRYWQPGNLIDATRVLQLNELVVR